MIAIDNPVQVSAKIDMPIQNIWNQRARAIVATGLVIVCVFGWLAFEIPKGTLLETDELLTAERTREMLLTEPWVVHFNFQRSFEKPPLQYWPGGDLLLDSFYLFHGNFRFPVAKYTVDEIRSNPPKPPLIGACVTRDFPVVQKMYSNVRVQLTRAQFVCWRVGAR
jgi:hypothetical protein